MEGVPWRSPILEGAYDVCGWLAFIFWASTLYPQLLLNFRRKSVVGLNFNYFLINNTKHAVYFIYHVCLCFSLQVQFQCRSKYGFQQMIPVAANDVALSFHNVVLTLLILFQIAIYDRGNQTVSQFTVIMVAGLWLGIIGSYFVALPSLSWLWFPSVLTSVQALMNCLRKSTEGFSIACVLLDISGGTLNYGKMIVQSLDQSTLISSS